MAETMAPRHTGKSDLAAAADRLSLELAAAQAREAELLIENGRLREDLAERAAERDGAREEQTATADVLRALSAAPSSAQEVLIAIAVAAAKLCGADDAVILRRDGDDLIPVARSDSASRASLWQRIPFTQRQGSVTTAVMLQRRTVHIPDTDAAREFPLTVDSGRAYGRHAMVVCPLLREGQATGLLMVRRGEGAARGSAGGDATARSAVGYHGDPRKPGAYRTDRG